MCVAIAVIFHALSIGAHANKHMSVVSACCLSTYARQTGRSSSGVVSQCKQIHLARVLHQDPPQFFITFWIVVAFVDKESVALPDTAGRLEYNCLVPFM